MPSSDLDIFLLFLHNDFMYQKFSSMASSLEAPFSVSDLSQLLKFSVEERFGDVFLRGEISGYKRHTSGHHYFSIKDQKAVMDAVCWRGTPLGVPLSDGLEVVCHGKLTTYPGRSKYQIVVDCVWGQGQGALLQKLEELKEKLKLEGLFDGERKKTLPLFPSRLGILTSATGAVIQDMFHRCQDRWPCHIDLYPVQVQGSAACQEIIQGLAYFQSLPEGKKPDVVIVARGGGSIEDLWPFHDEALVRAIAACTLPVVSAVGHETDTTLCDYVADLRAPTPTAAIELVLPCRTDWVKKLDVMAQRLTTHLGSLHRFYDLQVAQAIKGWLKIPEHINLMMQVLDDLCGDVGQNWGRMLQTKEHAYHRLMMGFRKPVDSLERLDQTVMGFAQQLDSYSRQGVFQRHSDLIRSGDLLETLSYRKTLARGFSLVHGPGGQVLSYIDQAKKFAELTVEFQDGFLKVKNEEALS